MEIRVGVGRRIVVDDNVDTFDVDTTSEDVGRDEDTFLKVLELFIARDTTMVVRHALARPRRLTAPLG